jgi:hypothetical protein
LYEIGQTTMRVRQKNFKKEIFCFNSDSLQRNEKVDNLLASIRLAGATF